MSMPASPPTRPSPSRSRWRAMSSASCSRSRTSASATSASRIGPRNPMDEVKPFPLLSVALQPLVNGGTINTETVFETGLSFMLVGVRASLVSR